MISFRDMEAQALQKCNGRRRSCLAEMLLFVQDGGSPNSQVDGSRENG
jgi:hypothetical protein